MKIKLSSDELKELKRACSTVWSQIASDVCTDGEVSNELALEMVLDAGRLTTLGRSRESERVIARLMSEHDYATVMKFLEKQIKIA